MKASPQTTVNGLGPPASVSSKSTSSDGKYVNYLTVDQHLLKVNDIFFWESHYLVRYVIVELELLYCGVKWFKVLLIVLVRDWE